MTKTIILIDDEADAASPADLYGEEMQAAADGRLSVLTRRPGSMAATLELIAEAKPDGLLLDVALTNALGVDGAPIGFDGIALAQQIRTMQTRALSQRAAGLPEFPLIRLSKKDVIREYVSGDSTSDDLFDEKIDKEEILRDAADVARRAYSLAADYPRVIAFARSERAEGALADLLGCEAALLSRLDARALLGLRRPDAPAHILARYLTGTLLARPGPLVAEPLLAVRLGVDPARSEDWPVLLSSLGSAAYRGPFCEGYPRWWFALVLDWWQGKVDADRPPFRLTAPERAEALRERTDLRRLEAFREDPDSPGLKFWHLCSKSGRPVDPSAGFALMPTWGQETWQDAEYLCLEEALRSRHDARLGPAERSRLAIQANRKSGS
jgi:hypothetical protein